MATSRCAFDGPHQIVNYRGNLPGGGIERIAVCGDVINEYMCNWKRTWRRRRIGVWVPPDRRCKRTKYLRRFISGHGCTRVDQHGREPR